MANEQNLKTPTPSEARKNGRKGGLASGKARREKKTIQKILNEYLEQDIKTNKSLKKIADTVGLTSKNSIKELLTAVCILNTLKKGDVDKLVTVCALLGEDNQKEANNGILEDLSKYLHDVK